MAGSFTKGAIPPDPQVAIPKIEDCIDVSSLAQLIADSRSVRG
jgi:hypothetical protein